jgi:hypothetical protein
MKIDIYSGLARQNIEDLNNKINLASEDSEYSVDIIKEQDKIDCVDKEKVFNLVEEIKNQIPEKDENKKMAILHRIIVSLISLVSR